MIAAEVVTSRTTDLGEALVSRSWQCQIRVVFFPAKLDVRGSPRALAPQERKPIPIYLPIHANNGGRAQHFQTEITPVAIQQAERIIRQVDLHWRNNTMPGNSPLSTGMKVACEADTLCGILLIFSCLYFSFPPS